MQIGLGGADVRPLTDEVCRQAQRQPSRETEGSQLKSRRQTLAREAPSERRKQIALLREQFFQRRQQQTRLRHRRFLRHHVGQRDLPAFVLPPQDVEQLGLDIDQPPRRGDLAAQRSFLDRGERDVRGERQVDRLALERLRFGLRVRGFDRAPRAAEHVGHERRR